MTQSRRVLLDTAPLYGLLDPRDQAHQRARQAFRQLGFDRLEPIMPYPAILELHRLLVTRKPSAPERAHEPLEEVVGMFGYELPERDDVEEARATLRRYRDQKLTATDATIAATARREGAQVLTFDGRHFGLMGAAVYEGQS